MKKVFISCGEQSGDSHAGKLVEALRNNHPALKFSGIVGKELHSKGVEEIFSVDKLSVMGFTDVLWALPRIFNVFYRVKHHILTQLPDLVILVDSPSFNLRLARSLRAKGYQGKLVQYISPSVWAWGDHRIKTMEQSLDLLLTIYPFEKDYFLDTKLRVEYVGNPLVSQLSQAQLKTDWRKKAKVPQSVPLISLFPGSRRGEVLRNLPLMLEAIKHSDFHKYHVVVSVANDVCGEIISEKLSKLPYTAVPVEVAHYELMLESKAALAKSGTVTLELALCNCPTVVIYPLTRLNKFMAKYVLRVNLQHYCIANILSKEELFPEYISKPPTETNIRQALELILNDDLKRKTIKEGCLKINQLLSQQSSAETAASFLGELLK